MKKSIFLSFSILCLVVLSTNAAFAQKSKKVKKEPKDVTSSYKQSKKEKERNAIFDKLWFGSGGALRYNKQNQFSVAQIGISPMVGYKFNSYLSAGPRLEINDYYIKGFAVDGEVHKGNALSLGVGVFGRIKPLANASMLQGLFLHGEVGYQREVLPVISSIGGSNILDLDADDPTKIALSKRNNVPVLLGLGYNMGMYEIYMTWDFNRDKTTLSPTELPIEYRIGLTWKF